MAFATVDEAQSLKDKLQTEIMIDTEKATAINALQNKEIPTLIVKYERLRKRIKKILELLRNVNIIFINMPSYKCG